MSRSHVPYVGSLLASVIVGYISIMFFTSERPTLGAMLIVSSTFFYIGATMARPN